MFGAVMEQTVTATEAAFAGKVAASAIFHGGNNETDFAHCWNVSFWRGSRMLDKFRTST